MELQKDLTFNVQIKKVVTSLFLLSVVGLFLIIVRVYLTGNYFYVFLLWNLLLAWVPLFFTSIISGQAKGNKNIYLIKLLVVTVLWLLFFPNAPYIITDFLHLKKRADIPLWFDAILLFVFSFTGLISGLISLHVVHEKIRVFFGRNLGWLFVAGASLLSGFGVYLGRFLRLNSWDVFTEPVKVFIRSWNVLLTLPAIGMTMMFFLIIFFSYLLMKNMIDAGKTAG